MLGPEAKLADDIVRDLRAYGEKDDVALVEQTPFLFRATIRENIAYGKPGAALEEIRACARDAAIHDFIQSLPEGYDTIVGERGCTISAGERQRIALARALLRDPLILILDEATAAIDPKSEAIVSQTLANTLRGRTVILITHRVSLVEIADLAVVLQNGRIVETGRPRELLQSAASELSRQFCITRVNIPMVEVADP